MSLAVSLSIAQNLTYWGVSLEKCAWLLVLMKQMWLLLSRDWNWDWAYPIYPLVQHHHHHHEQSHTPPHLLPHLLHLTV
jgi:hypothetical protein